MGVNQSVAQMLLWARDQEISFGHMATIGHGWLSLKVDQISAALQHRGVDDYQAVAKQLSEERYCDSFLKQLGADDVVSIDASSYEDANIIHDMNSPIGEDLKGQFDFVLDVGTLEHVFHLPNALSNEMNLVKPGGSLMICVPCANFSGHGFYTFSPELFFRCLSAENGFEIQLMTVAEYYPGSPFYRVIDPAEIGRRVQIAMDGHKLMLYVIAKKAADVPVFARPPQQSDYVAEWTSDNETAENDAKSAASQDETPKPSSTSFLDGLRSVKQRIVTQMQPSDNPETTIDEVVRRSNLKSESIHSQPDAFQIIELPGGEKSTSGTA